MNPKIGEDRKKTKRIVMQVTATVTVEWSAGVLFDRDKCLEIGAAAIDQRWSRDVGRPGSIVWAECYGECTDQDVEIIEVSDLPRRDHISTAPDEVAE